MLAPAVRGPVIEVRHTSRAGATGVAHMRDPAYWLLPTLTLTLALGGCGVLERQPEPGYSGVVPGNASAAGANIGSSQDIRPAAASAGANVAAVHEVRPANPRLRLNLHVFGVSYHPDREGTRSSNLDNELNIGLGINYEFQNDDQGMATIETGFFKDSGRYWAKFAGVGYQFKFGDRWRVGADLLAINSQTYNSGRSFIAPIPRLSYDIGKPGAVRINAVYVPKIQEINQFAVYAIYFSLQLGNW